MPSDEKRAKIQIGSGGGFIYLDEIIDSFNVTAARAEEAAGPTGSYLDGKAHGLRCAAMYLRGIADAVKMSR